MRSAFFALPIVLVLLAGCAPAVRMGMPQEASVTGVDVVVDDEQREIAGEITRSNMTAAAGGGLLFALADAAVNHSRSEEANASIVAVRDVLLDYDFNDELKGVLMNSLEDQGFAVDESEFATLSTMEDEDQVRSFIARHPSGAVLVVDPYYGLSDEFRKLRVRVSVKLHANDETLRAATDAAERTEKDAGTLYRNIITVVRELPVYESDMKVNAPRLAEDSGEVLEEAMDKAIASMVEALIYDMTLTSLEDEQATGGTGWIDLQGGVRMKGPIVRNTDDTQWIRLKDGRLCVIPF